MKALFSIILWLGMASLTQSAELPKSNDPTEFQRETREYILSLRGGGFSAAKENPVVRKAIEEDPRDWEAGLAEIIDGSEQYGMGDTEVAILTAILRKKGADPRISAATIRLFQHTVRISVERLETVTDNKRVITGTKGWIATLIAEMFEMESSDVLQEILIYFNSSEVEKLETLQMYAPKDIAPALQKYGDLRNAEEALKVAAKLESIGRADVATNIKRAAERIMKDAARKQATSPGGTNGSPKDASAPDGDAKNSTKEAPLWPWLAAGGALLAALVAYFRMKRAAA